MRPLAARLREMHVRQQLHALVACGLGRGIADHAVALGVVRAFEAVFLVIIQFTNIDDLPRQFGRAHAHPLDPLVKDRGQQLFLDINA